MAVPELRPLSVGEILDVAIKLCVRNASTMFAIVLVVVVPTQVLSALVDVSATGGVISGTGAEADVEDEEVATVVGGVVAVVALALLGYMLATAACFKAVADAYLGGEPAWRSSLAFAARRLHSVLWVSVLIGVLATLAAIPLILPAVWLFVAWTVAVPALLSEDARGLSALRRSFRLVRRRWWPTFGVVVLGGLLVSVVSAVLGGVIGALSLVAESEAATVAASTVANIVAYALTTPFYAAFITVLYFDLRVRKEAFDLQLLAERIGVEPGEARAPARPAPPAAPAPAPASADDEPPFWPPPPGWKPRADGSSDG